LTEPPEEEPPRVITSETLTSGPYISLPFIAFQTLCDEVRQIRREVTRLQEYLEAITREAR
jgi:ubiquinone biosynthesis protein UbiJ